MRSCLVAFFLLAASADACTTFCTRGLFGRNYDFEIGAGIVVVNKRGMAKESNTPAPAKWTSRFGSVTFNQFGRDNPTGGMNEKGLVVELMWLNETRYPKADARPELGTLEWIQYQLDNSATVADVIASAKRVRIAERGAPLHYLVADAAGDSASIEFLGGELVVHHATVLANDPYETSLAEKRGRFALATSALPGVTSVAEAFKVLDRVAQPHTQWSIVYDIPNRAITWRTAANREPRSLRFASLDFTCAAPVRIAPIDGGPFRDYTRAEPRPAPALDPQHVVSPQHARRGDRRSRAVAGAERVCAVTGDTRSSGRIMDVVHETESLRDPRSRSRGARRAREAAEGARDQASFV